MGKFVVKKVPTGIKFVLQAANGETVLDSEVYNAEPGVLNGIDSVRRCCGGAVEDQTVENFKVETNPKYELYLDKADEYRFRLKAKNGQIIGSSEGYKDWENCMNGIESVKANAPEAELVREDLE